MKKHSAGNVAGGYDPYSYFVDQIEALFAAKEDDWEKQVMVLLDILNRQQRVR